MAARKSAQRPRGDMDDHARIRAVFLDRRETYSATATADLSGVKWPDLLERIENGEIESRRRVTYSGIRWDDVARLLMERVPLRTIFDALGERADEVLPALLRLERLDMRVPAYVIRVLEWAARSEGVTVEQYFHGQLFEWVEGMWTVNAEMDNLPGVVEALFFPEPPPQRSNAVYVGSTDGRVPDSLKVAPRTRK